MTGRKSKKIRKQPNVDFPVLFKYFRYCTVFLNFWFRFFSIVVTIVSETSIEYAHTVVHHTHTLHNAVNTIGTVFLYLYAVY